MNKKIMPIWLWIAFVTSSAIAVYYLFFELAMPQFPIDAIGVGVFMVSIFTIPFRMIKYGKGRIPKLGRALLTLLALGIIYLLVQPLWGIEPYDPGFL